MGTRQKSPHQRDIMKTFKLVALAAVNAQQAVEDATCASFDDCSRLNAFCAWNNGGFKCKCNDGFEQVAVAESYTVLNNAYNTKCQKVTACMLMERDPARGPCGAFSQCIEDANGTKCVCQRGFEDDPSDNDNKDNNKCRKIHPCNRYQCPENSECLNIPNDGPQCRCEKGARLKEKVDDTWGFSEKRLFDKDSADFKCEGPTLTTLPVTRPNLTTAQKPKPTTGAKPKPTTGTGPKPTTGAKPKPTSGAQIKPTTAVKPKPTSEEQPKPTTGANPKPTTGAKPKPTTGARPKPTTDAKPKPTTGAQVKPTTGSKPKPTADPKPNPTTGARPRPTKPEPTKPKPTRPEMSTKPDSDDFRIDEKLDDVGDQFTGMLKDVFGIFKDYFHSMAKKIGLEAEDPKSEQKS